MTYVFLTVLFHAPLPFASSPDAAVLRSKIARYRTALHPTVGSDCAILPWLRYLDAQPEERFHPFQGERLGAFVLWDSARWAGEFFRHPANPHANRVLPSGYVLPAEAHVKSLVLYRWDTGGYRFVMQESSQATLLRVRPGRIRFSPKEGLARAAVVSILKDVLGAAVTVKGDLQRQFRLPEIMRPGMYASNATPDDFGSPAIDGWQDNVLVFATDTDFCVLLFKAQKGRQLLRVGWHDEEWLPAHLLTRDGKSLLIDALTKKKSGRELPDDTVTIPRR